MDSSLVPTVKDGCVVLYEYVVTDTNGVEIDRSDTGWPYSAVIRREGVPGLLPAIYKRLLGAKVGDRLQFCLTATEAYGIRRDKLCLQLPVASIEFGLFEGKHIKIQLEGGEALGRVIEIRDGLATIDLNHPLAGKDLLFDIQIIEVRDAHPDELHTGTVRRSISSGTKRRSIDRNARGGFPYNLFEFREFPGSVGKSIKDIDGISMFPPYPWGQWLYALVFQEHCGQSTGDLIELGVGLGGMSIFLGKLARDYGKKVISVDSFCGLPAPHPLFDNPGFQSGDYKARRPGELLRHFEDQISRFGLNDTVLPMEGWFSEVLSSLSNEQRFCFCHIDGDIYASVLDALEGVYDRVISGGVIVIDDFFHHAQGAAQAVRRFFNGRRLHPVWYVSFPYSIFMIKGIYSPSAKFRSIDGNCYSFDWLRRDSFFLGCLKRSLEESTAEWRSQANCTQLIEVLHRADHSNSDIYKYLAALEDFWDGFAGQSRRPVHVMNV